MKKKFESAEVRVIKFEAMDIMTASINTVSSWVTSINSNISASGYKLNLSIQDGKVQGNTVTPTMESDLQAAQTYHWGQGELNKVVDKFAKNYPSISGCLATI